MIAAIIALTFASVCLLVVSFTMERPHARAASRWVAAQTPDVSTTPAHLALAQSFRARLVTPLATLVTDFVLKNAPVPMVSEAKRRLERAGWPLGLTPPAFIGLRIGSIALGAGCAVAAQALLPLPPLPRIAAFAFLLATGAILPGWLLDRAAQERTARIRRALPDAMDLLVVSVEAGLGLDGAMQEVIKRDQGPLGEEFAKALNEIRLGKRRRDAWRAMAERVDVSELNILVAALRQAEQMGASIGSVLRTQGETMRNRRTLLLREAAAKTPVKMLFPLVLFIFPSMFVVMLGPGIISMVETFGSAGF